MKWPTVFVVIMLAFITRAYSQENGQHAFAALRAEVKILHHNLDLRSQADIDTLVATANDCNGMDATNIRPGESQYIYNGNYTWAIVEQADKTCVFLIEPFRGVLSEEEARDLLSASELEFPVPHNAPPARPATPPPLTRDPNIRDHMPKRIMDQNGKWILVPDGKKK